MTKRKPKIGDKFVVEASDELVFVGEYTDAEGTHHFYEDHEFGDADMSNDECDG